VFIKKERTAEEELDELHTENETPDTTQTFEAQCAELKIRFQSLKESRKVSGLKVRPVDEHTHRCGVTPKVR
jgi:hypothetical protein